MVRRTIALEMRGDPMESANRRFFWPLASSLVLVFIAAAIIRAQSPKSREFDLLTARVADIQAAVGAGALTYEHLVQLYLNRIEAYDKKGPRLNAVIEINSHALEIARALDAERKARGLRSPLHGIPVAVKDNIDVSDIPSAGGNLALAGTYPAHDAMVIRRLREAGAIILLKANMDELALGSQGLSSLGGQTLNPYDLKRNPGGSSGGTGVAVNVGFATVGLGTETGVSIRSPASNNAVIGIAPTRGLVSRAGVIPISFTQDRVGVHAKSVADAALVLESIRGFDPEDLLTRDSLGKIEQPSYRDSIKEGLASARVGVLRDLFRKGEEFAAGNKLIEQQIAFLREQRAVVVDGLSTGVDLIGLMPSLRLNSYELRFAFDAYLRHRGPASPVKSLAELAATGKYLKSLERQFQQAVKRDPLDFDVEYQSRLENQKMVRHLLIDLMNRYRVDALVYPFKALGAPLLGTSDGGVRDNPISSTTGLPAIVIPAGLNEEGLPIAIEFLGLPFSEPKLIQLAHAYEQASHRRVAPKSTPHLQDEVFSY
ncbi:MAG: amidase [Acidobacteria bacterium]|nr:MAG: amidase [Acidobacteriota bacterium]PYR53358.1 MAG: amidase [Acidobacteriota bacterium]